MQTFKEYLQERKIIDDNGKVVFIVPKEVQKHSDEVGEVTECLIACLNDIKTRPGDFKIAKRPENIGTIRHILQDEHASRVDVEVKKKLINFITKLPLKGSFSKSEHVDKGEGWVYVFIVKNAIEFFKIKGYNRNQNKVHAGTTLYLKFLFKTYEDENSEIKIDPETVMLDMISIHPTK